MIVGLTGGIGSGKSTIARFFNENGVPVYIADDRAKLLMSSDSNLIVAIKELLGDEAYVGNDLNRPYIAGKIFSDAKMRDSLNNLVHPAVAQDFIIWSKAQNAPYVIKEAAILFENGGYKKMDFNILVTAPEDIRIKRVVKRDKISVDQVEQRMAAQWPDTRKIPLADVSISNITLSKTKEEVLRVHRHLLIRSQEKW